MGTSIPNPTKIAPLQGHRPLCRGRGYKESESDAPVQLNSCCSHQQKSTVCEHLLVEVIHLPLTWKRFFLNSHKAQQWILQSSLHCCRERERGKKDKLM